MIKILCELEDTLALNQLTPFQGDLKKRSNKDIKELTNSIRNEGLIAPFVVYRSLGDDKNYLLDGHGRLIALMKLAAEDFSVSTQQFPVVYINAPDIDTAKKYLLQITSRYGRITKEGAIKFCASITGYRAPSVNKFVNPRPAKVRKVENTTSIIKIKVPMEHEKEVRDLLGQVSYITLL